MVHNHYNTNYLQDGEGRREMLSSGQEHSPSCLNRKNTIMKNYLPGSRLVVQGPPLAQLSMV